MQPFEWNIIHKSETARSRFFSEISELLSTADESIDVLLLAFFGISCSGTSSDNVPATLLLALAKTEVLRFPTNRSTALSMNCPLARLGLCNNLSSIGKCFHGYVAYCFDSNILILWPIIPPLSHFSKVLNSFVFPFFSFANDAILLRTVRNKNQIQLLDVGQL